MNLPAIQKQIISAEDCPDLAVKVEYLNVKENVDSIVMLALLESVKIRNRIKLPMKQKLICLLKIVRVCLCR